MFAAGAAGLFELLMIARGLDTAIMCAEILWWRCHRRIIADVLTSVGVQVRHIRDGREAKIHRVAPPARLVDGVLTYGNDDLAPRTLMSILKQAGLRDRGQE